MFGVLNTADEILCGLRSANDVDDGLACDVTPFSNTLELTEFDTDCNQQQMVK